MTAIKSRRGQLHRAPAGGVQFFLVHGIDEGLAHERSKAIIRKLVGADPDPLRLVRLDGEALARRPEGLSDEAYAVSMFGGSRAIWIDAQGRDLLAALEPLFARPPAECAIVIKAGQLKRGHALRAAFEKAAGAVAIECYCDEPKALGALIDGEIRARRARDRPDARAALLEQLGADRQTSRAEIAKLLLFARGNRPSNSPTSVRSCPTPRRLRSMISSTRRSSATFRRRPATPPAYFADGGDADELIGRLVARLTLLHRLRLEMEAGRDFEGAFQALYIRATPEGRRALARAARSAGPPSRSPSVCRRGQGDERKSARDARAGQEFWRAGRSGRWPARRPPRLRARFEGATRGGPTARRQRARLPLRRLAEAPAEIVELVEVAEGDADLAALAGVPDGDLGAEREAELVLKGERVGVDGRRLLFRARRSCRRSRRAARCRARSGRRHDPVGGRVRMRHGQQRAAVPRGDLSVGEQRRGVIGQIGQAQACWRCGCGSCRRPARCRREHSRSRRRAGRSPPPPRAH